MPSTPLAPAQNTWATFGLDRSFSIGKVELYVNALFVYKDGTSVTSAPYSLSVPNFELWNRNLVMMGELRFRRKATLGLRAISSFVNQDGWLHPYGRLQLTDYFRAEVGADFFLGPVTGFYGQYSDNDRIPTALTLNF